mmetsp:Transcript_26846/g.62758  ORF Transcript_26846/g.62758 Transcript_26846/m.62758 type:complete len:575 (-) Transcript_26846:426-2150(-)
MSMMDVLYDLVQQRNERETFPFVAIHDSNAALWKEVDTWEHKCGQLEHQIIEKEEYLEKLASAASANNNANNRVGAAGESSHEGISDDMVLLELHYAESAALKNERKLMEELERLRDQVKTQEERHQKDVQDLKEANESHLELKEQISAQERNLTDLQEKYDNQERATEQQERIIQHLKTQVGDNEQRANLAEQQCAGLKDTIRILQEEYETLKSSNLKIEQQSIKKEESMPVSPHRVAESSLITKPTKKVEMGTGVSDHGRRKIAPIVAAVVPSGPKQIIQAHRQETSCVRCDDGETQLLGTTGSVDGTVRIWNRLDGSMIATLKGGNADFIISCDVANGLAAAGGNDKTCRVWDIRSQRMLHQLVGHASIIICVRFVNDGLGVVTAAKDRQINIWDISKQTYRLLNNIVVNSSANSIDITNDSSTMVSGHTDGSLRLWSIRTGRGSAEIKSVHEGAISSVQFHPFDSSKVLTNGMDSRIKIIDLASCKVVHEFSHKDFHTSYSWSASVFSPDGAFVTAGSSSNGFIFVWNAENGKLLRVLKEGHDSAGVCGISWGREGLQSVDKKGKLILWS